MSVQQSPNNDSQLPTAPGDPFKTGNFNKFFFAIIVGALIFAVIYGIIAIVGAKKTPTAPQEHQSRVMSPWSDGSNG